MPNLTEGQPHISMSSSLKSGQWQKLIHLPTKIKTLAFQPNTVLSLVRGGEAAVRDELVCIPHVQLFSQGQLSCNYTHFNSRWERGNRTLSHAAGGKVKRFLGDSCQVASGGGEGKEIEEEVFL